MHSRLFISLCLILLSTMTSETANGQEQGRGIEFFEAKIRPVLVRYCYECHSTDAKRIRGGLRLDTRAAMRKGGETGRAVVPGEVNNSLIISALQHTKFKMPPKGKLPDAIIADFVRWIQIGAPDPRVAGNNVKPASPDKKLWSLQPPTHAKPPNVHNKQWSTSDIDRFLLAKLETSGLTPNADALRDVLLRRATFDLIGLPPTIDEISAFQQDNSPDAFAKVVDRLLALPQFGQRWARHWLDVARFAESAGQSRNISYRFAWRYRNWVIDAFNQDMPFDRFVMEQIAGDLLPANAQDELDRRHIATGFLLMGPKLLNENNKSLVYRMGVVDDQIDTTFRAFMGLTVGCARCHDHKYDPIPTRDYYALAGIFRSTENLAGVQSNNNTIDNGLYPLGEGSMKILEEIAEKQKAFEQISVEFAKARRAKQSVEQKLRDLQKKGAANEFLKEAKNKVDQAATLYRQIAVKRNKLKKSIPPAPPSAMAVREAKKIFDSHVFVRGDVRKPGVVVSRGTLTIFKKAWPSTPIAKNESGRLQLARWIADRRNTLTARVIVNRVWQHLFGTGLVKTPDNFGTLGQPPSHPMLLDFLALQFMDDGWSIKRLIRRLMLSRAYQMSSDHDGKSLAVDPENRLLWRMSRRPIQGEAIRDAMLAVAGRLDLSHVEGSVVSKVGQFEMNPAYYKQLRESYAKSTYRSVYLPVMRAGLPDMLKAFDAPDPSLVAGKRDITIVAPQALLMLNDTFVREQAAAAGKRIVKRTENVRQRAQSAFRLILGRSPTAGEAAKVASFVQHSSQDDQKAAWTDVCHVLMATAEFRTLY